MTLTSARRSVLARSGRLALVLLVAAAATLVAWSFFAATTFIGDDHVFLAFARLAPNPLVAFVRDQHGGEFYRPLPMLVWWLVGRAAGVTAEAGAPVTAWPFAALALAAHVGASALLAALLVALGRARAVAGLAAALFALAPQNLEAASWYAASTDLFATVFVLASLLALARGRVVVSALLALGAYLSKESALVLPALAFVVLGAGTSSTPVARRLRLLAPHVALALVVVLARLRVLGGWGGSGDAVASAGARVLQLVNGLVHVGTGAAVLPEPLAWGTGGAALALVVFSAARATRARCIAWAPLAFVGLALAPLPAAGWIVGARYFYLPAVGLAWAGGEALAARPAAAGATLVVILLGLGAVQASARSADVASYVARVSAARRAVAEGARNGARVFHVAGGIKDLDLAVKEDPALASVRDDLLVLGDVPASFALIPSTFAARAAFLVATPPLPPSGAYRFGEQRVVGLARRGDDPTLDDVVGRFPDLRFIRLRPTPGGHVFGRDVTGEVKAALTDD